MTRAEWLDAYRDMRIRNRNWRGYITWRRFRHHALIWRHDYFAAGTEAPRIRFVLACRVDQSPARSGLRLHDLRQRLALHALIRQVRAA